MRSTASTYPLLFSVCLAAGLHATASRCRAEEGHQPDIQLFYYSEADSEWAVSLDEATFETHRANNTDSNTMFESMLNTANGNSDPENVRQRMGRWINQKRQQFDQSGGSKLLFRKSEGILAYLRAHDFDISELVAALKDRSGASGVQLVGMHLVDRAQKSSFKLKVILQNPQIEIGRQGFNVDIRSPEVTDLTMVFALGVALYEVHEILNDDSADQDAATPGGEQMLEPIPAPALQIAPPKNGEPTPARS